MDSSDDDMLFGDTAGAYNNSNQQSPPEVHTSSSPIRTSRAAIPSDTTVDVDTDEREVLIPLPSPATQDVSPIELPPGGIVLPPGKRDRQWVIAGIEAIFEQQVDGIVANNQQLFVTVQVRTQTPSGETSTRLSKFQFPGSSEKDAWRYTVVMRILEIVHEALVTESIITKRDIYYRDPALFSNQNVVDRYVDNLACTFGVSRLLLNVAATAKGLISGSFTITRHDGTIVDGRAEREGILISRLGEGDVIDVDCVQWILVVEKEATFRAFSSSDLWKGLQTHGVLVTAKGYPDIATRSLLRTLALPSKQNNFKQRAVYALVDFDPDGIDILSTYKHGSAALAHEKANLELPVIQWIGLQSKAIGYQQDLHQAQGLLSLSTRDRRKANRMLEREPYLDNGKEPSWRREIQGMLFLNVKAEIQLLEAQSGGLCEWLKSEGID